MGYHDRYALLQLSPRYPPQLALIRVAISLKFLLVLHTGTGQGSTYSFISAELVNELKLKVTPTQDRLHMTAFSSGPISILTQQFI